MNCEQKIGNALFRWFCAVTEILNEYNSVAADYGYFGKDADGFKEFTEIMSKKLLESFRKVKDDIAENVKGIKNDESVSFEFSDCSNSPSPTKKELNYKTPPNISQSLIDTKEFTHNSQKQSRIKKLSDSKDVVAINLFKTRLII